MDIFLFGHPCFVRLLINLVQFVLPPFFSLKLLASGATMYVVSWEGLNLKECENTAVLYY